MAPPPRPASRSGVRARVAGVAAWVRANLFGSPIDALVTVTMLIVLWLALSPFVEWAFTQATLSGETKADCLGSGACWVFVKVRLPAFFYGRFPPDERWRVNLAALLLVAFAVPALSDQVRRRSIPVLLLVLVFPVIAGLLLHGGMLGLSTVDTTLWGGLMLNTVLSFVAVAGGLPLGVILALGRRSKYPVFRLLAVGFIELWRGVPLLTALFMGVIVLPLFLPDGVAIDTLVRAMVALTLFTSAYMAEIVRGGLQAIPPGQEEAAKSLGLSYWPTQLLIVLPQALRLVVPNIVNTVLELYKDTTLVVIVGLFDLLGVMNQAIKDSSWLGMANEGYVFVMTLFFCVCFVLSRISRHLEKRLGRGRPDATRPQQATPGAEDRAAALLDDAVSPGLARLAAAPGRLRWAALRLPFAWPARMARQS